MVTPVVWAQSARVNSGDRSVLIVDVGGEFSVLSTLTTSAHLLAATAVAASLSLGRSVSAATAVGPALLLLLPLRLLLLLGELWVCLLALHSAKLVGLWGLSAGATRGALLLKREGCRLDDPIGLQGLDFTG